MLNAPVLVGAYLAARFALGQPAGAARGLSCVVLAWTWATLGLVTLGPLGHLTRPALLAWSLVGLASGVFSLFFRRNASASRPEPLFTSADRWDVWATIAFAGALLGVITILPVSLLMPAKVVSDGPIYHLYFAARWWKDARIFPIASMFGENAATYFPAGGDAWFAWLMVGWGGDRLARVGQAPFLIVAGAAALALARRLGAGMSAAVVAACWFVTSLPLMLFSVEANVDTIFVAGYMCACYFGARYALDGGRFADLFVGSLAAGLALGTKPTAVAFIPPLLGLGVLFALGRGGPMPVRFARAATVLVTALIPSGYWFARNIQLAGNPLYPLHVQLFGKVILAGAYESSAMVNSQFYIPRWYWQALVDVLRVVLDPRMAPFWLLAIAGAWRIGRASRALALGRAVWICAGLAVVNVALYWLLIPYRTQQRFMLQALGLAVVPLGCLFDRHWLIRASAALLVLIHLATPLSWPLGPVLDRRPWWDLTGMVPDSTEAVVRLPKAAEWSALLADPERMRETGFVVGLAIACFAMAWVWGKFANTRSWRWFAGALAATAASFGGFTAFLEIATGASAIVFPQFADYQAGWRALESASPKRGYRIAYAGTNLPYYLMCGGLRNDVQYINIDKNRDWLLHDYQRSARERGEPSLWPTPRPGWDRIRPDYGAWLANLRAAGIEVLVVARANPNDGAFNAYDSESFPIERYWAETHPDVFEPFYGAAPRDRLFKIFRVRADSKNR